MNYVNESVREEIHVILIRHNTINNNNVEPTMINHPYQPRVKHYCSSKNSAHLLIRFLDALIKMVGTGADAIIKFLQLP